MLEVVQDSTDLKIKFARAWLNIFEEDQSIAQDDGLKMKIEKHIISKLLHSRFCVYIKIYKDSELSKTANKDYNCTRRELTKAKKKTVAGGAK